ncbi:hypothetical protein [Aeromicrobium sp.]|uniref:hypothetical protein n=1 Tax=Aeromicrobium sp. TaxID=1871063 RepID=UPI003519C8F6
MRSPAPQESVVVGGTGMLRGVVEHLRDAGSRTVVVSRRAGRTVEGATAVAADWTDPQTLAERLAGRHVDVAVLWVHHPYRQGVVEALEPSLADGAVVVHVWGSSAARPRARTLVSSRPDLSVRHVVLGFVREDGASRWLSDDEIVAGVVRALDDPAPEQVVGVVEPWDARP